MNPFSNNRAIEEFSESILTQKLSTDIVSGANNFYNDINRLEIFVDGIYIPKFENHSNKEKALLDKLFHKYNYSSEQKDYYGSFIRLFINQRFIYLPALLSIKQLGDAKIVPSPNFKFDSDVSANLRLASENTLYLTVNFSATKKYLQWPDEESLSLSRNSEESAIFEGMTTFKIEINPYEGKKEWIAKFGLVESSINCDEYNHILDSRKINVFY